MLAPHLERAAPGGDRSGTADRWCLTAVVLTAGAFAVGVLWARSQRQLGFPSHDIYAFFYPNTQYALHSLREWSGLLWNPYQDCGQPFFAFGQVGLLYPVNVVFLLLPREAALVASAVLNLAIGGAGMFMLCRQMELGRPAALGGACAFQLGGTALQLVSWSPIHIGAYVWLPVAMWATERLITVPTLRRATILALVLAIQLLPGFVQTSFFTYQLIALRILWAVVFGQTPRPSALIAAVAFGLVLACLLAGVQLLPSLEVARESLRPWSLPNTDLGPGFTWQLARRYVQTFVLWHAGSLVALAALPSLFSPRRGRQRADIAFYVIAAVLHFLLSLGPGMPLFDFYASLPLTTAFRSVVRLIWVSNFAVAVLTAFGIETILHLERGRAAIIASVLAGAVALQWITVDGLPAVDWMVAGLIIAATALAQRRHLAGLAQIGLPLLVALRGACFGEAPLFDLRSGDLYGGASPAFHMVRERLTPQDRVLIVSTGLDPYAFTPKTASLYRIPNIFDYETQASRSYAEFFTYMRTGRPIRALIDWYWVFGDVILPTLQRPLFDLTAARYLIANPAMTAKLEVFDPPLRLLHETAAAKVYENPRALSRARYVPRIAVTAADEVLPALAHGAVDLRTVALVTEPPRSGFVGLEDGAGTGTADIVTDEPERVVVRVRASAPGFLFLADQYFPGWYALVNGREQEISRANHTFRLVEVPAGESEVEFRYRPRSVAMGAVLSLVGIALFVIVRAVRR